MKAAKYRFDLSAKVAPAKVKKLSKSAYESMDILDSFSTEDADSKDFQNVISQIMKSQSHVLTDPRMDMRELPMAKNSFEWMFGQKFLAFTPWARQLEIIGKLNADVCAYCTPEFYDEPHDHKWAGRDYKEYFQYLNNGVCPECNRGRARMIKKGRIQDKTMLIGVAGQRCLSGNVFIQTEEGPRTMRHVYEQVPPRSVQTPYGDRKIRHVMKSKRDTIYRVFTKSGRWIDLNSRHRMYVEDKGYRTLEPSNSYSRKDAFVSKYFEGRDFHNFFALTEKHQKMKDIAGAISARIASKAKVDAKKHTGEHCIKKYGTVTVAGNQYLAGDVNAKLGNLDWLWGNQNEEERDTFFYFLGKWEKKLDINAFAVSVPFIWSMAFAAWLDELGVDVKVAHEKESVFLISFAQAADKKFPLVRDYGEAFENFASRLSHERSLFGADKKTLGGAITDYLKSLEGKISASKPVWEAHIYDADLFRTKLLEGVFNENIAEKGIAALKYISKATGASLENIPAMVESCRNAISDPIIKIECVGSEEVFDIEVPEVSCFYANGLHSHNSSKSVTSGLSLTYQAHRMFHINDTPAFFGELPGTIYSAVLTATTITQAQKNVYIPAVKHYFENAPWFKLFNKWLNEKGNELGQKFYKINETQLFYKVGCLQMICVSPNKSTIRGFTAMAGLCDELGHYDIDSKDLGKEEGHSKQRASGLEVHSALVNAMQTMRLSAVALRQQGLDDVPFPISYNISSPFSETDPIMTLKKNNRNNNSAVIFHYPTWKFNPKATKRDLMNEVRTPTFMRDFGAVASRTSGTFISDIKVLRSMLGDRKNAIIISRRKFKHPVSGKIYTTGKLRFNWKPNGGQTIMSLDAGVKNNHFAINIANIDPETGAFVTVAMGEVKPFEDAPIHFTSMVEDVIEPLIDAFNVKFVASDRWMSVQLLQDIISSNDVQEYTHSLKLKDFIDWSVAVQSEEVLMPREEIELEDAVDITDVNEFDGMPVAHFYNQCMSVVNTGKNLEKGRGIGVTDDLFRAHVLGWRIAKLDEVKDVIMSDAEPVEEAYPLVAAGTSNFKYSKPKTKAGEEDGLNVVSVSYGANISSRR